MLLPSIALQHPAAPQLTGQAAHLPSTVKRPALTHTAPCLPGARTGRSCDLASAASAMSLDSMGSCEDMGKVVLRPCVDPAAVLATVLKTLGVCNVAKRLELDWQANNEVRLSRGSWRSSQCWL